MHKPQWDGEFFVPDKSPDRIRDDHLSRYKFAQGFVKGKKVLDIACGVGYGSMMLKEVASFVVGVDISEDNILYASEFYKSDNLKFEKGDIRTYGSEGDILFDFVVCFETIEHVLDYISAASNIYSLLSPGGKLIISSPNRLITSPSSKSISDLPSNRYHTQEFTIQELIEILRNVGFKIGKEDIFGQRQRIVFRNKGINYLWNRLLKPDFNSDPEVKHIGKFNSPRYFVLICSKD